MVPCTYPMVSEFGFPDNGRHPKSLVPFKEEPSMIRIIVFCGPFWGPPFLWKVCNYVRGQCLRFKAAFAA